MRYGTPPTGTGEISNLALDGLTDEDKAKILRRHLVTPEDRRRVSIAASETDKPAVPGSSAQSRRSSGVPAQHVSFPAERENSDSFPIPYEAQGADVTYVPVFFFLTPLPISGADIPHPLATKSINGTPTNAN